MGQTLTHGIYLPDEGERNCYDGLAGNWQLLDGAVGTVAEHTTALAGKAPAVHTHTKSDVTDLLNSNFIPSANNSYDLGSSSYQWNNIYGNAYISKSATAELGVTGGNTTITFQDKNGKKLAGITLGNYASSKLSYNRFSIYDKGSNNQELEESLEFAFVATNQMCYFRPSTTDKVNLGSSSSQWNNVYAKSYYYNGVAWGLDKENVWSETNTFNKNLILKGAFSLGNVPSANAVSSIAFKGTDDNASQDIRFIIDTNGETYTDIRACNKFTSGALSPSGSIVINEFKLGVSSAGIKYIYSNAQWQNNLTPLTNNTYNLGTSTNKWKSLNGVNPGALSLPDMSSGTGVSLSAGSNSYSPPSSGWLSINLTGAISVVCGNFCHSGTDMLSVPVVKGSTYTVTVATSGTAYLFVSQGNV